MEVATLRTLSGVDVEVALASEGGSVFIAAAARASALTTDPIQASATNLYRWIVSRGVPETEPGTQEPSSAAPYLAEISVEPPDGLIATEGAIFPGGSTVAPQRVWHWHAQPGGAFQITTEVDHCELELELGLDPTP
ncbi:hypothetical protein [Herbiconiux liukaitaii]|uniref:hypothetical protein n=1 Tax=Herbiconiux liukaitaii TaxID=3342799 RepID=UPI0035BA8A70